MEATHTIYDISWILICSALVLFMQGGFCCLESGLVRAKNSINVAIKNFVDFFLSAAVFWLFGFAIMFGDSFNGWFGTTSFHFNETNQPWLIAFFVFQLVFCGTATTIISGAVAERTRFSGYVLISIIVSGFIYPFIGHWAWGGAESGATTGWLASKGFIDFAGSTVVHSTGGWVALACVLIIGPRIGQFDKKGIYIQGQNLPLTTLGAFILWLGWLGFNGGSTLALTDQIPVIILNTILSGAFGGLFSMLLSWKLLEQPKVEIIINGALAGMVGITASCNIVSPLAAVAIGSVAGAICFGATLLLIKFRIDDVVGAFPVHGCAGIWGTLAVAIFADPETWGTGLSRWNQFIVQLQGVGICFIWAFGVGFLLLWLLNKWSPFRVSPEDEEKGLNVSEHGSSTAVLDLLTQMQVQKNKGGNFQPVSVDVYTEVGQIATQYNRVMEMVLEREKALQQVTNQRELILDSAGEGIYGLDLNGNTTFCNPAAAHMVGFEVEELIGKPQHAILHHSKPDGSPYPREECPIYAAFHDGKVHSVDDEVFWKKDGTSFPVEYVSFPSERMGVLTYSTGKLLPSLRQKTSWETSWTFPSLNAA